ncbi:dTDP-4-dehydrorhamnose reductase [Halorubrum distributum JCM 9100]|uniref:dTDP-4-dehydrorhamnose reductase n=2 Tax=Halorubrum distributum TaxID=29283 RepID=M0EW88_9EURY|nr:sugar nucleotide-binding protein [Halorubrum distributum]ELZ51167.1 dTDP-4-dehydrorhamnose reductase [Halorubrum distributum JCM 9100]ELZ53038.1 dTDP-4-dehydrorhamnose reductase [Halorubrum distributum JCM 10118]
MTKRILIVGKSGLLGTKLHERLVNKYRVGGVSKSGAGMNNRELDITEQDAVETFFDTYSFDVVIHVAANTDVDFCEHNQTEAWETNVEGTKNLVLECKKRGIKFCYLSSDYIFSGANPPYEADANPDPVNYYGMTKLEGERIIREELHDFVIIRPGKLYGYTPDFGCDPFTSWVRNSLSEDSTVRVDDSIVKYPTLIDDVSRFVEAAIESDWTGLFNFSGPDSTTKYEWARSIAANYGFDSSRVEAKTADPYADRPQDVRYVSTDFGIDPHGVETGIEVMYKQEYCSFRPIYRMDIAEEFQGQSSGEIRKRLGAVLAREDDIEPDVVVPIPKSGIYPAIGYAEEIGSPLEFALSKQQLRKRTLYDESIDRINVLEEKMRAIKSLIENKTVAVVDEAVLSGKTLRTVIPILGAASKIHVRISSPPVTQTCPAYMHPENSNIFVDDLDIDSESNDIESAIAAELNVSSVKYVDRDSYLLEMGVEGDDICSFCFHS